MKSTNSTFLITCVIALASLLATASSLDKGDTPGIAFGTIMVVMTTVTIVAALLDGRLAKNV